MFKTKFAQYSLVASAGLLVAFAPEAAHAANNLGNLATNVATSLGSIPGLLSAISYLFGVILIILGIIKIKEHVEKPDQTPLKEGAIRELVDVGVPDDTAKRAMDLIAACEDARFSPNALSIASARDLWGQAKDVLHDVGEPEAGGARASVSRQSVRPGGSKDAS